jgi:hypothetical protein
MASRAHEEGRVKVREVETPRQFFDHVVDADVAEFRVDDTDLRLAYHACISLFILRDWIMHEHRDQPWTWNGVQKPAFHDEGELEATLIEIGHAFKIVADIANTTKHMIRRQRQRQAKTRIVETAVIHSPSMLGSMGFNTATPNQVDREVEE